MNQAVEKVIRKSLHIPRGELLTIFRLPGWQGCPLGDPEMGTVNCPLAFDTGKWSANDPPLWMRERLSKELLAHCRQCQGEPQHTPEEAQINTKILKTIMGNNEVHEISTKEVKKDES